MADLTPDQIEAARAAGIIPDAQADALLARHGINTPTATAEPLIGNEEDLRFLRSFSDIFITIGVVLLMVGIFVAAFAFDDRESGWGGFVTALIFWGLAEYFGRIKRAHLPTLAITIGFALALSIFVTQFFADRLISVTGIGKDWFVPAAVFLGGIGLYYWRIRLPFVFMLLGWGGVVFVAGIAGSLGLLPNIWAVVILSFVCAFGVLAAALWYDMKDPERVTRFSDNGFWLHTVASPLTLLSFMALGAKISFGAELTDLSALEELASSFESRINGLSGWAAFVIVLSMLWGLAINRRVFVISTLIYALTVASYFLGKMSLDPSIVLSASLLIVGGTVVFLGVGWHPARKILLRLLPNWKIFPKPERTDI